jgi:hypothetical protein
MNESNARAVDASVERESRPGGDRISHTGWPELRPADRCDGENPTTGRACINGDHHGYHRDASGAEWLDD